MATTPPSIQQRVMHEQVAALYATTASATIADVIVSWAVALLFWWKNGDSMALVWITLHSSQLLRYPFQAAYFKDSAVAERTAFWARRHRNEMLWYSGTWALAPWLMLPRADTSMTAVLVLVVLGVTSTGIPAVAPRWASVLGFAPPMVLGLIGALLWQGGAVDLVLALCCLVYLGVSLYIAHSQHHLLAQTLQSRFEKEALAQQLEQQMTLTRQASEEKTRFLAAASHDLRQPLHAIGLFGAALEQALRGQPAHQHALRLEDAVRSLHHSLGAMLDISRLDAGVMAPERQAVALRETLLSMHRLFTGRAQDKNIALRIRTSSLHVTSDPQMLERLLGNLVENAIKYTHQGGVLVTARQRGQRVWIEVVDTGLGIEPGQHELVFREFYQVDNPSRDRSLGMGIGLSIVRRLSTLLEHPVSLSSRPGRGTRFRLSLPLAPTGLPAATPPAAASPTEGELPRRVLLIDDEAIVTQGLMALMHTWGVELLAAADEGAAQEAMRQAAEEHRPVDVILSDMRLRHGVSGLDVARRLQVATAPPPALVMITGETSPEHLRTLEHTGLTVLFKPVDPQLLRHTLIEGRRVAHHDFRHFAAGARPHTVDPGTLQRDEGQ
ncbi:hybrid sensor histidine kinase/response regulator [Hydrogenophaga taeniospiralis]|uniref:ATP-binding response regulator n=1 Tax=Hydrogenophaga taeniospiralis TaxID=65656 RepID=UPI001CFC15A7|nr:hybrid sensor histidine kinase/response regulator [Hydrogenophaga taeniospiralis]MCB4362834.1 hybrid sensor histidine kinase/response regulator [Hydrogenophaga taeniospiralis]